ncbi:MAG: hypothetical protein AAFP84_15730 [Actinomycetota bacterium]
MSNDPAAPADDAAAADDVAAAEAHRAQAVAANNLTWDLAAADRSPENGEALLRAAYASAHHWQFASWRVPANEVRASYMIAKAHLLAGNPELSLEYADRVLAGCHEHDLADFDLAYAHEARARALDALGRADESLDAWRAARAVPISDPDDQAIVDGDFADAPPTD